MPLRREHRVIAAGPSIIGTIAKAAPCYGLVTSLAARARAPEAQLPFTRACENLYNAGRNGRAAQITWLVGGQGPVGDLSFHRLLWLACASLKRGDLSAANVWRQAEVIGQRGCPGRTGAAWRGAARAKYGLDMAPLLSTYSYKPAQRGAGRWADYLNAERYRHRA